MGRLIRLAAPLVFLANGLIYMSLFTRLPDVAKAAGLPPELMGALLSAIPVGVALTLLWLPHAAARFPAQRLCAVALVTMVAAGLAISLGASLGPVLVALALVVFGSARSVLELSQNRLASDRETVSGKPGMALAHGGWSIGVLAATGLSSLCLALKLPLAVQLSVAAICLTVVLAPVLSRVSVSPAPVPRSAISLPDRHTLGLFGVSLGFMATENMVYAWGLFYLRDGLHVPAARATLIYGLFTIGMLVMRFSGDFLRMRLAPSRLVAMLGGVCILGLALLLLAQDFAGSLRAGVLVAGLTLLGAGVALNGPVMARAALDHGDAQSFVAMSGLGLLGGLLLPVLFGGLVARFGFWSPFAACLPVVAGSGCLATKILGKEGRKSVVSRAT